MAEKTKVEDKMDPEMVLTMKHKRRPARRQVKETDLSDVRNNEPQTGTSYNIWYNKWAGGDREDARLSKTKSLTRCSIERDAGYTRGDSNGQMYCCLFFARGCCPYGPNCNYLHSLPLPSMALPEASRDVFAREKHADYRDDMGGVGSFSRQNRTLYVGRITEEHQDMRLGNSAPAARGRGRGGKGSTGRSGESETEKVLRKHFGEWGEIERIRVLHNRGCGFVTYVSELNAQFAREAMANQSLDHDEVLNVRWATVDPNPAAQRREKRQLAAVGEDAIARQLDPDFVEAMQSVDRLERGILEDEEGGGSKRQRIEQDHEEAERNLNGAVNTRLEGAEKGSEERDEGQGGGILSKDTMAGLQYLQKLREHQAKEAAAEKSSAPTGLAALGGYGSDSDEE